MTTLTHTLAGAALAKFGIQSHLLTASPSVITAIGIVCSNLPDFDMLYLREKRHHRTKSVLHFPLFWITLFSVLFAVTRPMTGTFVHTVLVFAGICVAVHFVMDTFGVDAGISWLAPVSRRNFSFFRLTEQQTSIRAHVITFVKSPVAKIECAIGISSILYLLH